VIYALFSCVVFANHSEKNSCVRLDNEPIYVNADACLARAAQGPPDPHEWLKVHELPDKHFEWRCGVKEFGSAR
jgi:hypothetical protein